MRLHLLTAVALWLGSSVVAFTTHRAFVAPRPIIVLNAGGFEWEDPVNAFDQGVDNPYKNTDLMTSTDGGLKIDPARLLSPRLNGANLYFIGMMGSGKTSVGEAVARRMGSYTFLDTDAIIEKATKMTIPEIFEAEGEEGFRQVEAQILDSVHPYVRCVISTGGGIVTRMENWSKLQTGLVIWLDVEPEVIIKRIQGTDRPLLQTEDPLKKLKALLEERKPKYKNADIRVKVTEEMDTAAVADQVIYDLHHFIDDNPPAWKLAKAKAQAEGLDWVQ
ncbi:shikimate kinase [Fistulifera solaris]|uniref:shikimate kinase n=1 Tax=Fistulifera solaris TaxID=1519565 RepID=A0A1Z5KE71_FISSO|nr:shikimate kinase [Fistulifera solaris]|eukprot:GAX24381.1 shikimate kinase [Fistulifera solaris]